MSTNNSPYHKRASQVEPMGDWREGAICSQVDPETFFPEKGGSTYPAKSICAQCDVVEQCLEWALANEAKGVWGGKSDNDRKVILRERNGTPAVGRCGTTSGYAAHYRRGEKPCEECRTHKAALRRQQRRQAA